MYTDLVIHLYVPMDAYATTLCDLPYNYIRNVFAWYPPRYK